MDNTFTTSSAGVATPDPEGCAANGGENTLSDYQVLVNEYLKEIKHDTSVLPDVKSGIDSLNTLKNLLRSSSH